MFRKKAQHWSIKPWLLLVLGFICILSVLIIDKLTHHQGIVQEGLPNYSYYFICRSIVIFFAMVLIGFGLMSHKKPNLDLFNPSGNKNTQAILLMTFIISVCAVFLFLFDHNDFSTLSLEDGPIELLSALLLFIGCFIFLFIFFKYRRETFIGKLIKAGLLALCLVLFVMAMEEVSWFQRVLDIETPQALENNIQHELNLHNLATDYVEIFYYLGVWSLLTVFPFLYLIIDFFKENAFFQVFIPRSYMVIIGAITTCYNYDMWNNAFIQISFFASIVILAFFIVCSEGKKNKILLSATILLLIITQVAFLSNGSYFNRIWEVTEYKEFFLSLGLCLYALDIRGYLMVHYEQGNPEKLNVAKAVHL